MSMFEFEMITRDEIGSNIREQRRTIAVGVRGSTTSVLLVVHKVAVVAAQRLSVDARQAEEGGEPIAGGPL